VDWQSWLSIHFAFKNMKSLKCVFGVCVLFFVIQLTGCDNESEPSTDDNTKDRQAILENWADNIIIPSYGNFKVKFDMMHAKAEAFQVNPNETTLGEFRSAWVDAYTEWQKVELFQFGPAEQFALRNYFNIYPTNTVTIQNNINNPSASLETAASYSSQGFPALDYMINGLGADDAAIVAAYTNETEGPKRLAYLERLTVRMSTLITSVMNQWIDSYRDTFITKTSLDIGSSTGIVVNSYIMQYEQYVRSGKVGIPAGIFSSSVPLPEKVEALYKKDISKTLALTAHQAAQDFFNGKSVTSGAEGPSFKSYLDALGAKDETTGTALSTVINTAFDEAEGKINVLSQNFYTESTANTSAMVDAYTSMQKVVRLLKVDMSSAMSITITYVDSDGD
jgi:hypothetical protein